MSTLTAREGQHLAEVATLDGAPLGELLRAAAEVVERNEDAGGTVVAVTVTGYNPAAGTHPLVTVATIWGAAAPAATTTVAGIRRRRGHTV